MSLPPAEIGPGEFYPVVGVGPHPKPWPVGEYFDPELLENGDRRNVLDKYRYWKVEAIVADLNTKRHPLRVAIDNCYVCLGDAALTSVVVELTHRLLFPPSPKLLQRQSLEVNKGRALQVTQGWLDQIGVGKKSSVLLHRW